MVCADLIRRPRRDDIRGAARIHSYCRRLCAAKAPLANPPRQSANSLTLCCF